MSFPYNVPFGPSQFAPGGIYYSHHNQDAYDYGADELPVQAPASHASNMYETTDPRLLVIDQSRMNTQQGAEYHSAVGGQFQIPGPSDNHIDPMLLAGQNGMYEYYAHHDDAACNYYGVDAIQVPVASNVAIEPMMPVVVQLQSGITSQPGVDYFAQQNYEAEVGSEFDPLFDSLTDETDTSKGESPALQVEQGDSNAAEADIVIAPAPVEHTRPIIKQIKRTRDRLQKPDPRTRVNKQKSVRVRRTVARSSMKVGTDGENTLDRICSHCHETQSAKEFGNAVRYHSVCSTCREKRGKPGDATSYCMSCKGFKPYGEFTLNPKKNEYGRCCNHCRARDLENKRKVRARQKQIAIAATTDTAGME
ncbi:hypothetical protein RUND412_008460 [Rhizina undulata]